MTATDKHRFACKIKLRPRLKPTESLQSNGMSETFVRTMKREYARVAENPDAKA